MTAWCRITLKVYNKLHIVIFSNISFTFTAAWLAVREVFPSVEVKGCALHWSQAFWQHVQQVGLVETYRRRQGVHSFVRMLLSIQFLPAAHIRKAFDSLVTRATTAHTLQLVNYIRRKWLENPTFNPEDWSVFKQIVRTNNDVGGKNNKYYGQHILILNARIIPLSALKQENDIDSYINERRWGNYFSFSFKLKDVCGCWTHLT